MRSGLERLRALRPLAVSAVALCLLLATAGAATPSQEANNAVEDRELAKLEGWVGWLRANDARGFVGEVGWPYKPAGDVDEWNAVGEKWYRAADEAGLWVTYWNVGEWTDGARLSPYEESNPFGGVDHPNPQAEVLEAHPTTPLYMRGVDAAAGASWCVLLKKVAPCSNRKPGRTDHAYHFDSQKTYDYLASRGIKLIRLPIRWERIQRRLGGPLNDAYVDEVWTQVDRAYAAGMVTILDIHNFGQYYLHDPATGKGIRRSLGSRYVTNAHFADLWKRISAEFMNSPGVMGYDLMNEPVEMRGRDGLTPAEVWERASQAAVRGIRSNDDNKMIYVCGYAWCAMQVFQLEHPDGWIVDPANNFMYQTHQYFDRYSSGYYEFTWAEELQYAQDNP